MSKRRRWLLRIALGLVTGGLVVWRILAPDGRMEVKLVFIGYTNTPLIAQPAFLPSGLTTMYLPEALLCATNTGSVSVKLWAAIRLPNSNTTQFAQPTGRGLPTVVKPGESVIVSVRYPMNSRRWQTEFMYQRHTLTDELYAKAWNTGSRTVQYWMQRVLPYPKDGWAQSGWITNTLPWVAAPGFGSTGIPWTRRSLPAVVLPQSGAYLFDKATYMALPPIPKHSDVIDASRPRGRYHITAPPDWGDIDFSDLSVTRQ